MHFFTMSMLYSMLILFTFKAFGRLQGRALFGFALIVGASLYFAINFVWDAGWPNLSQFMLAVFGGWSEKIVTMLSAGQSA